MPMTFISHLLSHLLWIYIYFFYALLLLLAPFYNECKLVFIFGKGYLYSWLVDSFHLCFNLANK
jgi:hypothetical protein